MKILSFRQSFLLSCFILLISSCAVVEEYNRNYQEATVSYPEPVSLSIETASTGLLVIDAETQKALNSMPLSGVAITPYTMPDKLIEIGALSSAGLFSGQSGIAVVSGLLPGKYRIVKVKTKNINMWESLNMPPTEEYVIDIQAGVPVYFGQIQIKHPMGTTNREVKVIYDKKREIESWQMVMEKYKDSPWVAIVTTHVSRLD